MRWTPVAAGSRHNLYRQADTVASGVLPGVDTRPELITALATSRADSGRGAFLRTSMTALSNVTPQSYRASRSLTIIH